MEAQYDYRIEVLSSLVAKLSSISLLSPEYIQDVSWEGFTENFGRLVGTEHWMKRIKDDSLLQKTVAQKDLGQMTGCSACIGLEA